MPKRKQQNTQRRRSARPTVKALRRGIRRRRPATGAYTNLKGTVTNRVSNRMVIDGGTEHIRTIDSLAEYPSGSVIAKLRVTPGMATRSNAVAKTFQQYAVDKLVLRITSQSPTNVAGGYMVGFISDPTDNISDADAVKRVRAANGSKTAKIWENITCPARMPKGKWYWTSETSTADERLVSPGIFYIVCTVQPSSQTPLLVSLDWQFKFRQPSLEEGASSIPGSSNTINLDLDLYLDAGYSAFTDRIGGKDEYWEPSDKWLALFESSAIVRPNLEARGLKFTSPIPWSFTYGVNGTEVRNNITGMWYNTSTKQVLPMLATHHSEDDNMWWMVESFSTGLVAAKGAEVEVVEGSEPAQFDAVGFRLARLKLH